MKVLLLVLGTVAAALAASSAGAAAPTQPKPSASRASATAPLPDSVVVRFPHRDLTLAEVQTAWYRQAARYRPPGTGLEVRRTFVDQLIEREVLAQAALAEPFVATEPESARYLTERARLLSFSLYSTMVYDSLELRDEDWKNARLALTGGMEVPDSALVDTTGLAQEAKQSAARRRSEVVSGQIRDDLAPAWDDSVAALLARRHEGRIHDFDADRRHGASDVDREGDGEVRPHLLRGVEPLRRRTCRHRVRRQGRELLLVRLRRRLGGLRGRLFRTGGLVLFIRRRRFLRRRRLLRRGCRLCAGRLLRGLDGGRGRGREQGEDREDAVHGRHSAYRAMRKPRSGRAVLPESRAASRSSGTLPVSQLAPRIT